MSRRILVTGSSRGLGCVIAQRLLSAGHLCVGTSRTLPGHRAEWPLITGDQRVPEDAARMVAGAVDAMGGLDGLVLNAGVIDDDLIARLSPERFGAVVETNLMGPYNVLHAAMRHLSRIRNGRVVFIASTAAFTGGVGQANYAASKAGLTGLARSAARELGRRGTTVNVVAPGLIESDMADSLPERVRTEFQENVPMRRLGVAAEVAEAVEFLMSDRAGYITGAMLPVDGGYSMGL